MELDPEEPPSLEELQARYRCAEKIRNILTPVQVSPQRPSPDSLLGRPGGCLS